MKKFQYAFTGLLRGFEHPSILLQFILGICAIIAGIVLHLTMTEWLVVITLIGCVITCEILNTCIEKICDMYSKSYSTEIRDIKDLAAGAVLCISIVSFVVAIVILLQHI